MFVACVQQNIPKLLVVLKLLCIVQVHKLVLPVLQLVFSATGVAHSGSIPSDAYSAEHAQQACTSTALLYTPVFGGPTTWHRFGCNTHQPTLWVNRQEDRLDPCNILRTLTICCQRMLTYLRVPPPDVQSEDSSKGCPSQVWQHQLGCIVVHLVEFNDGGRQHPHQSCDSRCNT